MLKYLVFVLLLLNVLKLSHTIPTATSPYGKLIYILMDGMRFNYVDELPADQLPGFNKLIKNGVKAEYVRPLRPTLSYPTWTTLSTGLYAESHGIVGNYFYDAENREYFSIFDDVSTGKSKWWSAEPIWTTATKAGLDTALFLWSRCDIVYDGVVPKHCDKFVKITGPEIFKTNAVKALAKLEEGYDFIQIYGEHVDTTGHKYGPESDERRTALKEMDQTLLFLQDRIEAMNMTDQVNIVIVSDHGMTDVTEEAGTIRLELDDYLPPQAVIESIADRGAYMNIKVGQGYLESVYDSLVKMPGVKVYKRTAIPREFHLLKAKHMQDILIVADIGYFIMSSKSRSQVPPYTGYLKKLKGAHGYSPDEPKMRTIFYAKGPAFKAGEMIPPIEIVDIYQVVAKVLNIEPRPNNGTWDHVKDAFADDVSAASTTYTILLLLVISAVTALLQ